MDLMGATIVASSTVVGLVERFKSMAGFVEVSERGIVPVGVSSARPGGLGVLSDR
jgi:hypothetical protein